MNSQSNEQSELASIPAIRYFWEKKARFPFLIFVQNYMFYNSFLFLIWYQARHWVDLPLSHFLWANSWIECSDKETRTARIFPQKRKIFSALFLKLADELARRLLEEVYRPGSSFQSGKRACLSSVLGRERKTLKRNRKEQRNALCLNLLLVIFKDPPTIR